MRPCPQCSADNADEAVVCARCGRRLLPLPGPRPGAETAGAADALAVAAEVRARRTVPLPPTATGPLGAATPEELLRPEATPSAVPHRESGPKPLSGGFRAEPSEPTLAPPPTRHVTAVGGGAATPLPVVAPLPEPPDGGLFSSARYTISFLRGVWQRRAAVRTLHNQIRADTTTLDGFLGALGRVVRQLRLDNRSLAAENRAIDEAEERRSKAELDSDELARRLEEENQRFVEQELDRENKLGEAGLALDKASKELDSLEAQRRALRDKRKTIERQQRAYVRTAEERESEAGKAPTEEDRVRLRQAAEDLRREAAALDPERQDLDRRLSALEKPTSQAAARVEALRGEQESIRRTLHDLREGHRHRLSEIEAEQGRRGRDVTTAESEIGRRLVTLGTLLNLNRIERPEFDELYARVDQLRNAIGTRTQEIDRLVAERDSYERGSVIRGIAVLALALVVLTTAVVLLLAFV